jgi:exosortase H (IPTLxxWG-CTERM-specific)
MLRFMVVFLGLIAAFLTLGATAIAQESLQVPLCSAVAAIARLPLGLLGDATASGNWLGFDGFGAVIIEACNGFLPTAIYVAAVLAFPCAWRAKAWGLLLGIPAIQLVNVARIVSLMILGAHWPALFERVHIFVWQTLVISLTMAIWVGWIEAFVVTNGVARAHR